jgi:hypothetical protein
MELTANKCIGSEAMVIVASRKNGKDKPEQERVEFQPILATEIWWDNKVSNKTLTAKQVRLENGKIMPACIQGELISTATEIWSEGIPDTPELLTAMGFKEIEYYQQYQELKHSSFVWRFVDGHLSEKTVPKSANDVIVNTYGTFIK